MMEQTIDQLSTECVPSREELLAENQRLKHEIDSELRKAEELSVQLQRLEKGMLVRCRRPRGGCMGNDL